MQLNHIANTDVASSSGRTLPMIDPSDGRRSRRSRAATRDDIDAAVRAARGARRRVGTRVSRPSAAGCSMASRTRSLAMPTNSR